MQNIVLQFTQNSQAKQNKEHGNATILLKYSYIMMFISYLSVRFTSSSTYLWFALNTVVDVRHFAKPVYSNVLTQPILASKSIINIPVSLSLSYRQDFIAFGRVL